MVGGWYWYTQVDDLIRSHLETRLAEHYTDLQVTLRSAKLVDGNRIVVRGLRVIDPQAPIARREIVTVDEIDIGCNADIESLLQKKLDVTQVAVRGMHMRAHQTADGQIDVARLWPLPKMGNSKPKITWERSTVEFLQAGRPEHAIIVNDLRVVVDQVGPDEQSPLGRFEIQGEMSGNRFGNLRIAGWVERTSLRWSTSGTVNGLEVSPQVLATLPAEWAAHLQQLNAIQGRADCKFQVSSRGNLEEKPIFAIDGDLRQCQVSDARLPFPVNGVEAHFFLDNTRLRIDRLTGSNGRTTVELSGQCLGLTPTSPMTWEARLHGLQLDEQLSRSLPASLQEVWNRFQPAGVVNADVKLIYEQGRWVPHVSVQCLDVSFMCHEFPYRMHAGRGTFQLDDQRLQLQLEAQASGSTVHFEGELVNPGPRYTGWVHARSTAPIPIDQQMIDALQPKPRKIVESLNPRGAITFQARMERNDPTRIKPSLQLTMQLQDCTIQYDRFPYPLHHIRGTVEMADGNLVFRDLTARNDSGNIACQGYWHKNVAGSELVLNFTGTDIPLEDELRDALPEATRRMWTQIRPRGAIDQLDVGLRYDAAARNMSLQLTAHKSAGTQNIGERSISIEPEWFPYRMEELTGTVDYRDGNVLLKDIRMRHGNTTVVLAGQCDVTPDGAWQVQLEKLVAERLQANHNLVSALPRKLGAALASLNLVGPVNLNGSVGLRGNRAAGVPVTAVWNLHIDLAGGSIQKGIHLEHIHGTVHVAGAFDGREARSRGELAIDSLVYDDIQVTQVRGPFRIDLSGLLLGAWAEGAQPAASRRQLTARVYNGTVSGDGHVSFGEDRRFKVNASVAGSDLAQIAREKFSTSQKLKGTAFATLDLTGTSHGTHTWQGKGIVRLRDADIYELPVMVSLLKVLSINEPDRTAFTTSDIDYRIDGDHLYLDRVDFSGNLFSLKGSGEISFAREMNLDFYTMIGRHELSIPILQPLLGEASRQFMLIHVTGPFDQPKTSREAFPGLNETFQQLFPENDAPQSQRRASRWDPRNLLPGGNRR